MSAPLRQFRVFRKRHLAWLIPVMLIIWVVLANSGLSIDVAFLAAMSAVPIGATAYAFQDGAGKSRYWLTYCVIHGLAMRFVGGDWIPKPAVALAPLFIFDYLLLAYLFPVLSGVEYDYPDRPL
jgi:hypothetical protein